VPIIEGFLDELQQACWFSTLDLCASFHRIQMNPADSFKIAFQTHVDHYEFRVMSFGLTSAPHTFQKGMNSTLAPFLRKFVLVFFDDILVYSKSYVEHLDHLEQVFKLLWKEKWTMMLSKCSFAQQEIAYLGYAISAAGVSTCPKKVIAVADWPQPQNVRELRGFLGLVGYCRKLVKFFGIMARPLTDLLKKHSIFCWNQEHEVGFQQLKLALIQAPVLALPKFSKTFCVETDVSEAGVGAVLMQEK
jgi:hypothetical protein